MDNPPKLDPRFLGALEACRPGSDDLSDAEFSALADRITADPQLEAVYDRLKQTDTALAEAFHDVPIPDGLSDRILDRLASAGQSDSAELPRPAAERGNLSRKRWGLGAVILTLAGSLMAALLIRGGPSEELTAANLTHAAVMLFDQEGFPLPEGSPTSEKRPPGSYPISPRVAQFPGIRWRWVVQFLDRKTVAYDLPQAGGTRATLYVVKRKVPGLPGSPPFNPAYNSRNRSAAAWQSGGLLYVLVVDGGKEAYRNVLGMSSRNLWT